MKALHFNYQAIDKHSKKADYFSAPDDGDAPSPRGPGRGEAVGWLEKHRDAWSAQMLDSAGPLRLMTVEEAALALHSTITTAAIRSAISGGALRGRKIGKRFYTTAQALKEFVACQDHVNRPVSSGTRPTPSGSSTTARPGIGQAAANRAADLLRKRPSAAI